jgi:hypothetical protein
MTGAEARYKDIYTADDLNNQEANYGLTINLKGDAIYETSSAGTGYTSWFGYYLICLIPQVHGFPAVTVSTLAPLRGYLIS